jgi:hypothetical protein
MTLLPPWHIEHDGNEKVVFPFFFARLRMHGAGRRIGLRHQSVSILGL